MVSRRLAVADLMALMLALGFIPFIGDYNGLAINFRGVSYPVWTGVRPGKMDSDIFFAVVP